MSDHPRWLSMLTEDLDDPAEAEAMLDTVKRLKQWSAPSVGDQEALLQVLLPALPKQNRFWQPLLESLPYLLLRAQIRVVRREIWLASALVMMLGTVVTILTYQPTQTGTNLPLVLIAPLVTAIGIAYLYMPDAESTMELEYATPISPRLILLGRLMLLFSFDLALGLLGSVALVVLQTQLSLMPLIMTWLAPMAFLSAFAFFLSIFFLDPAVGAVISMGLWILHNLRMAEDFRAEWWSYLPNLTAVDARPGLFVLALLLCTLALWLAGQENRLIRHTV